MCRTVALVFHFPPITAQVLNFTTLHTCKDSTFFLILQVSSLQSLSVRLVNRRQFTWHYTYSTLPYKLCITCATCLILLFLTSLPSVKLPKKPNSQLGDVPALLRCEDIELLNGWNVQRLRVAVKCGTILNILNVFKWAMAQQIEHVFLHFLPAPHIAWTACLWSEEKWMNACKLCASWVSRQTVSLFLLFALRSSLLIQLTVRHYPVNYMARPIYSDMLHMLHVIVVSNTHCQCIMCIMRQLCN